MHDFYVYIHLRADSGLPFYIGKGRRRRAWCASDRGAYWKRIARRHGVIVEILHEGLVEEAAFQKEKEEIAWARQYFNMINVCDGGEGACRTALTEANKLAIFAFLEKCGRLPSQSRPDEHKLRKALDTYRSPSSHS